MFNLRMADEFDRPGNLDSLVLRLDTVKLNAGRSGDRFDTLETAKKIKMPPGAAKFTVGCKFQSDFLTILSISRSSTAVSAAASISFRARLARASLSGAVRSRLPT